MLRVLGVLLLYIGSAGSPAVVMRVLGVLLLY